MRSRDRPQGQAVLGCCDFQHGTFLHPWHPFTRLFLPIRQTAGGVEALCPQRNRQRRTLYASHRCGFGHRAVAFPYRTWNPSSPGERPTPGPIPGAGHPACHRPLSGPCRTHAKGVAHLLNLAAGVSHMPMHLRDLFALGLDTRIRIEI